MLTALTRAVSRNLQSCELTHLSRQPIDIEKAIDQHSVYEKCLAKLGINVIRLPALPDLADATFVEDPAVVFDEVAVLGRLGVESRQDELPSVAQALAEYREVRELREPATLEGGDVMVAGKQVFVGLSSRTNAAAIDQLRGELAPFGYTVDAVEVHGCLHLKTACSYLGDDTILLHREWIDPAPLDQFRIIDVASAEPWAANVLRIGEQLLMVEGFPATECALRKAGFDVATIDISELMKAEAGLTCMSLIFETN